MARTVVPLRQVLPDPSTDDLEVRLLVEGIYQKYGYDFRDYAWASLCRRVQSVLAKHQVARPLDLLKLVLDSSSMFKRFLSDFTVTTSEMFRDAEFYRALREKVSPVLKTYPTLSVWIAGCASGEELYSVAITLKEVGLLERSIIYATDINPAALDVAREGIYSADAMKKFTTNYHRAGGRETFSDYYAADYGLVKLSSALRENVVFSEHNLVTDSVFAETHLVLCRNVLIYFNKQLQGRALMLFLQSLRYRGFLALGDKESVRFSESSRYLDDFCPEVRILSRNGLELKNLGDEGGGSVRGPV